MVDWQADVFRPPFPLWITLVLLLGVAALGLLLYVRGEAAGGKGRRSVLILLRGLALLAMAWLLLGPSVLHQASTGEKAVRLSILIDTSASMAERDVTLDEQERAFSRLDALQATWLSDDALAALSAVADVHLHGFDDRLRSVSQTDLPRLDPAGKETRLYEALRQAADASAGDPPTLLLLSDGHDTRATAGGDAVDPVGGAGSRVYVVPVGSALTVPDIAVQAWPDADFLFEGQSTLLHAGVLQHGFGDRRVQVDLLHEGRLIDRQEVAFDDEPMRRVAFRVTPEMDPRQPVTIHQYQVRTSLVDQDGAQQETHLENNVRPVFLQVSRQRIKVLLAEGQPYWDTRFLAQSLRADPHIALTAMFDLGDGRALHIQSPDESADESSSAALDQALLNDFDVVILGRAVDPLLPDPALLIDYVQQRGGALVLARGQPYEEESAQRALSPILPVAWGRETVEQLTLELTPQGARSPLLTLSDEDVTRAVLTRLPGMIAATRIVEERAASIVLLRQSPTSARTPSMAALAHQRSGGGQVLAVLTDGLWQWGLLPGTVDDYESIYDMFWSRTIRWLATGGDFLPGREVAMTLDRLTLEPDEPVGVTVTTRFVDDNYQPAIRITDPTGEVRTVEPQPTGARRTRYRTTFRPVRTGIYHLALDRPTTAGEPSVPITARLAVHDRSTERLDPSPRPQVLEAIADATGGRRLGLDDVKELVNDLQSLGAARASDTTAAYDFARPWVLAVIVGCLGVEWLIRRRGGLL